MCKKKMVFEEKIQIYFYLIKHKIFWLVKKIQICSLRDTKKMVLSFVKDQIYFDDDKKWFFYITEKSNLFLFLKKTYLL